MRKFHFIKKIKEMGLFKKLFFTLIIFSLIPVISISSGIYLISEHNLQKEVSYSNLDLLKQIQLAVDNILQSTERISEQILANKEIQTFMNVPFHNISAKEEATVNIANIADSFLEGVDYIDKMTIYSFLNDVMVSSGLKEYQKINSYFRENYSKIIDRNGFVIWTKPGEYDVFGQVSDSLQFTEFIFETFNKPQGMIRIKFKNDEFIKMINNLYIRDSGYIFIIDDEGKTVLNGNKNLYGVYIASKAKKYIKGNEGYEKIPFGPNEILVSYTTSSFNRWKYVAILPANELGSTAENIRYFTSIVCILFTILSIYLSFAIAKGIYNPLVMIEHILKGHALKREDLERLENREDEFGKINKQISEIINQLSREKGSNSAIINENSMLKKQLDENTLKLKSYFLYRMIYGDINNKEEITNGALQFGIPENGVFAVIIFEFQKSYNKIMENLSEEQKSTIKSGITNLIVNGISDASNVIDSFFELSNVNERVVLLVSFDGLDIQDEDRLKSLKLSCGFIQNVIEDNFKVVAAVAIGNTYCGIDNISKSYIDANKALEYKFVLGNNAIILKNEIDEDIIKHTPIDNYNKYFISCLRTGNANLCKKMLIQMKDQIKKNPSRAYAFYFKDLIKSLIAYLDEINYLNRYKRTQLEEAFLEFERKFENIDEAVAWFIDYSEAIIKATSDDSTGKNKLVIKAIEMIKKNYMKDICLSQICYQLHVSQPYFSKLFKEEVGKNFIEYLTLYKISKAKEMLRETDTPINKISEQVGYYNHTQFTKMFKKYEGITPIEYRNTFKSS